MIVYNKFFALARARGVSIYHIEQSKVVSPPAIQRMREGGNVTTKTINALCKALDCQPGDLMEYLPDKEA